MQELDLYGFLEAGRRCLRHSLNFLAPGRCRKICRPGDMMCICRVQYIPTPGMYGFVNLSDYKEATLLWQICTIA